MSQFKVIRKSRTHTWIIQFLNDFRIPETPYWERLIITGNQFEKINAKEYRSFILNMKPKKDGGSWLEFRTQEQGEKVLEVMTDKLNEIYLERKAKYPVKKDELKL